MCQNVSIQECADRTRVLARLGEFHPLKESWNLVCNCLCVAEAAGEVEEGESGGRVAAGVGLGEVAGQWVHLLAELAVAHDGGAPLLHDVVEFGLLAVVGHPAGCAQGGEGLRSSAP